MGSPPVGQFVASYSMPSAWTGAPVVSSHLRPRNAFGTALLKIYQYLNLLLLFYNAYFKGRNLEGNLI
jgi:hypothetical protein